MYSRFVNVTHSYEPYIIWTLAMKTLGKRDILIIISHFDVAFKITQPNLNSKYSILNGFVAAIYVEVPL